MGRYKRNKKKVKKEIPFVSTMDVIRYIFDNKEFLNDLPKDKFQISKKDISFGDRWYSEDGYQYEIKFPDQSEYHIGVVNIVEDAPDWGQAEAHQSNILRRVDSDKKVTGYEILTKLKKYRISLQRRTIKQTIIMKTIEVNYSVSGVMTMLPLYATVTVKDPKDYEEVEKAVYEKVKDGSWRCNIKSIKDIRIYI